jgi:hypothetical protein
MTSKLQQKVLTQEVQVRGVHVGLRCGLFGCPCAVNCLASAYLRVTTAKVDAAIT